MLKVLERQLAVALGYTDIEWSRLCDCWLGKIDGVWANVPRACHDNEDAFSLMVKYGIQISFNKEIVVAGNIFSCVCNTYGINREAATRLAIVQAVLAELSKAA